MPASSSASQAGFQQQPLLGVHRQRLARADAEERGVEVAGVGEEAALARVAGAGVLGVGVVEALEVPAAVGGELGDRVAALGDQLARAPRGSRRRRGSGRPCRRSRSAPRWPGRGRRPAARAPLARRLGEQVLGERGGVGVVEDDGRRQAQAGGGASRLRSSTAASESKPSPGRPGRARPPRRRRARARRRPRRGPARGRSSSALGLGQRRRAGRASEPRWRRAARPGRGPGRAGSAAGRRPRRGRAGRRGRSGPAPASGSVEREGGVEEREALLGRSGEAEALADLVGQPRRHPRSGRAARRRSPARPLCRSHRPQASEVAGRPSARRRAASASRKALAAA